MAVVSIILGHGYTTEDNLNNDTNDDILCKCGCEWSCYDIIERSVE